MKTLTDVGEAIYHSVLNDDIVCLEAPDIDLPLNLFEQMRDEKQIHGLDWCEIEPGMVYVWGLVANRKFRVLVIQTPNQKRT